MTALRRRWQALHSTSRTDAGVHALDQNASFTVPLNARPVAPPRLRLLLNRWLPDDIRIVAAELAPAGFHARFSAVAKAYTYAIGLGERESPFWNRYCWWHSRPLDLARMRAAADILAGRHDFAAFAANPRRELETTVREIHRFEVLECRGKVYLNVVGDGFLYKMVRSLAGYLVEIGGEATWRPEQTQRLLAGGQRISKVKTAPAHGLFLARVFFSPEQWREYRPLLPPVL